MPRTASRLKPRSRPRRVGRPRERASKADVRAELLSAAAAAFSAKGFDAVSLRDVADRARTTPAMVHYYFGDKHGLYAALLEETLAGVLVRVREALASLRPSDGSARRPLEVLFDVAHETIGATPWIPQLVLREVLTDGAPFRDRFIEQYAKPMSKLLRGVLNDEREAGRIQSELDVDLAFVSLVSLAIFPFTAQPVIERVLGREFDDSFRASLAAHTKRLFHRGVRA